VEPGHAITFVFIEPGLITYTSNQTTTSYI
jgi:hypothetical protein